MVVLIVIVSVGVVVTLSSVTKSLVRRSQRLAGHPDNSLVAFTAEYQITFTNLSRWETRSALVSDYMQSFEHFSFYFKQDAAVNHEAVRRQYYLDVSGHSHCNSHYEIRVREIRASNVSTATVDIKENTKSTGGCFSKPFWPASTFNSSQKCERDVHATMSKYSRESRVIIDPRNHTLKSCGDLSKLYPWAFGANTPRSPEVAASARKCATG